MTEQTSYKKIIVLTIITLAVVGLVMGYVQRSSNQTTSSELVPLLENSIAYLEKSRDLKKEFLEKKISEQDYNTRKTQLEIEIEELNIKLHSLKIRRDVGLDEEIIGNLGDALQITTYLIFQNKDLKNISDEIMAMTIIIDEIKSGI